MKKNTSKATKLYEKTIALCLTGSVAIIEAPKLARDLRKKFGANVQCFMTESAVKYGLSPKIMEWATKKPVVTELTGFTEHMTDFDLVIVYPATFNTINKIAVGIADNAVSTLCAATPVNKLIIVPAMNIKLYNNPILKESITKLEKLGVKIIKPKIEEGVAKVASIEEIINCSIQTLLNEKTGGK